MHLDALSGGQPLPDAVLDRVSSDGNWHRLNPGVHYHGRATLATRECRQWARRHRLHCRTRVMRDRSGVVVYVALARTPNDLPSHARRQPPRLRRGYARHAGSPLLANPAGVQGTVPRRRTCVRARGAGRPAARRTARSTRAGPGDESGDPEPARPRSGRRSQPRSLSNALAGLHTHLEVEEGS